jgi:hypothetical protein
MKLAAQQELQGQLNLLRRAHQKEALNPVRNNHQNTVSSEMKSDSEPTSIPTKVNGQARQTTEINNTNHMRNILK